MPPCVCGTLPRVHVWLSWLSMRKQVSDGRWWITTRSHARTYTHTHMCTHTRIHTPTLSLSLSLSLLHTHTHTHTHCKPITRNQGQRLFTTRSIEQDKKRSSTLADRDKLSHTLQSRSQEDSCNHRKFCTRFSLVLFRESTKFSSVRKTCTHTSVCDVLTVRKRLAYESSRTL